MAEDLTGIALSLVRDAGGRLGPDLWAAVASRLLAAGRPSRAGSARGWYC